MRRRGRVNASASDGGMSLPHSFPQHLSLAVLDFPIPVICDTHTSDRCHTPHTGRMEDRLRIQRGSSGLLAEGGDDRRPRGPCDFTLVHTDSSLQALELWPRYCNRTFGVREVASGFWRGQTLSWRQAGRAAVGCPENGWPLEAQPVFASGPPQSLPGSCRRAHPSLHPSALFSVVHLRMALGGCGHVSRFHVLLLSCSPLEARLGETLPRAATSLA